MAFKPVRSVPVIVQNRDVLEAIAGLVKATGSVVFGANATNTKILTIYDEIFEFLADLDDLTPGNIGVQIGVDLEATRDNLITALAELTRTQVDTPLVAAIASSTDTILLTYWEVGTVGNDAITDDDDNITVTGMSGGADGGVVNVAVTGLVLDPDIDIGDVHLLNIADAKIDPAEKGEAGTAAGTINTELAKLVSGIGSPQADLATAGTGLEVNIAIPAGAKFIDFFLDAKAYVAATASADAAFPVNIGTDTGALYMPNLNFRIPCQGATHLHLKGSTVAVHTLQWTAIS